MLDIELGLIREKVATDRKLSPLIAEYKDKVTKLRFPTSIDLRLLGSFGTGNEQKGSDLDPWLVLKDLPNLEDLSVLSKKEFEIRQKLSVKYRYPNLVRHRATILSKNQTDVYERSFALRVGIPHKFGAIKSLNDIDLYNPDVMLHPTDVVVTLREYQGLYDRNVLRDNPFSSRKFVRRIVQDITFYLKGEYITKTEKLDEIIERDFSNSEEAVMRESARIVDSISKEIPAKYIYDRELSHQCLSTMEKVVWELSRSYFSKRVFDEWRFRKNRRGAFYPVEIRQLIEDFNKYFKDILLSNDLLDSLARLEKLDAGPNEMEDYYQKHCSWMLKAANIALESSEKCIYRIL